MINDLADTQADFVLMTCSTLNLLDLSGCVILA